MSEWPEGEAVLLYDASCGLCDAAVRFVLRHERDGTLWFASLQGKLAHGLFQRHPDLRNIDSLIVARGLEQDPLIRSEAALAVARHLKLPWRALLLLGLLPRRCRDWAYDVVARHRDRVSSEEVACLRPAPEVGDRFLG